MGVKLRVVWHVPVSAHAKEAKNASLNNLVPSYRKLAVVMVGLATEHASR